MAIGYDPSKVKVAPTSFKSLLTGSYKNQVAIDGNPTQTGSAFAAVYAAALANGGSLANIAPGVTYFKNLKAAGNFVPVEGTPATVQSGQTPILIWWDYLLDSEVKPVVKDLKIVIPSDGVYAGYYDQAISQARLTPPPPGCGRSTCTRPRARTSSSRARPARSSRARWPRQARSNRPRHRAAVGAWRQLDPARCRPSRRVHHGRRRRRPAVAVCLRLTWLI